MIATAVSEMVRNIVRFADAGEVVVELLEEPRRGIRVVARDTGPGIPDVEPGAARRLQHLPRPGPGPARAPAG